MIAHQTYDHITGGMKPDLRNRDQERTRQYATLHTWEQYRLRSPALIGPRHGQDDINSVLISTQLCRTTAFARPPSSFIPPPFSQVRHDLFALGSLSVKVCHPRIVFESKPRDEGGPPQRTRGTVRGCWPGARCSISKCKIPYRW
nr:hypothetical protein CFP56_58705 [Quercus suber]